MEFICLKGKLYFPLWNLRLLVFLNFFFKYLFFEREKQRKWRRVRDGGRESHTGFVAVNKDPNVGLEFMNHEIMTWDKIKSQTLNQLSHLGTPRFLVFSQPQILFISNQTAYIFFHNESKLNVFEIAFSKCINRKCQTYILHSANVQIHPYYINLVYHHVEC